MYMNSFDGSVRAMNLVSRIASEDRVGDSLLSETIVLYARKMRHVANRMTKGKYYDLTPEIVVRDLVNRIENEEVTRATARVDKAASLFWLAEQGQKLMDSGSIDLWRFENAYLDIQSLSTKNLSKNSGKTSSNKLKAFPDEAVMILEKAALIDNSESILHALLFVRANLHVGLRPTEWYNAKLVDYKQPDVTGDIDNNQSYSNESVTALEVLNAKHSPSRGNGISRTIVLTPDNKRQLNHIQTWLKIIEDMKISGVLSATDSSINMKYFAKLHRAIVHVLSKAGWVGEMPSMYSTRHQAVANAKADCQSQKEIAALFGHSSTDTARRYYGKKYDGYAGRSMRATAASIRAVRSKSPANYSIEKVIIKLPSSNYEFGLK